MSIPENESAMATSSRHSQSPQSRNERTGHSGILTARSPVAEAPLVRSEIRSMADGRPPRPTPADGGLDVRRRGNVGRWRDGVLALGEDAMSLYIGE